MMRSAIAPNREFSATGQKVVASEEMIEDMRYKVEVIRECVIVADEVMVLCFETVANPGHCDQNETLDDRIDSRILQIDLREVDDPLLCSPYRPCIVWPGDERLMFTEFNLIQRRDRMNPNTLRGC
jgi:hypothetical protein